MILVALGTQDKQFFRLVRIIDNAINKGIIKDEVVVQLGSTKYSSSNMKMYSYISGDKLQKFMDEADLIVCHGGVGIITDSLKKGKKVFAMPRLREFNEHRNNHQNQLVDKFNELGYIKKITSYDNFVKEYKKLDKFKPKKPTFNNKKILDIISDFIG